MTSTTSVNEVDLAAVAGLTAAVEQDPQAGATRWQAQVRWNGGFRSEARIRDFAPLPSDEPPGLGGTDTAPNPAEQLLAAFGNCLAVGYAANATAAGIEIRDLSIDLEGDLDLHTFLGLAEANAGYSGIRVTVHLDADATDADLAALHDKVTGTSPVGHTLARPVPLRIELA